MILGAKTVFFAGSSNISNFNSRKEKHGKSYKNVIACHKPLYIYFLTDEQPFGSRRDGSQERARIRGSRRTDQWQGCLQN